MVMMLAAVVMKVIMVTISGDGGCVDGDSHQHTNIDAHLTICTLPPSNF